MTICDFLGGWIAGMVGLTVGHPVDTVKIRQQIGQVSTKEAIENIYKARGWKGFFRGLPIPMLANGFLSGIFFAIYGWAVDSIVEYRTEGELPLDLDMGNVVINEIKTTIEEDNMLLNPEDAPILTTPKRTFNPYKPKEFSSAYSRYNNQNEQATYGDCLIGGSFASFIVMSVSSPVDLIKVKLQGHMVKVNHRNYKNEMHVIKRVYQYQGIKGFYKGARPLALRNFFGGLINCVLMKACVDMYPESPHYWYQFIPAAITAGMISWWVVVPLDVIKTRMQLDTLAKPRYRGMGDCASQIVARHGYKGLFRGIWLLSLRSLPVQASTYLVYEYFHTNCKEDHRLTQ